jgi:acyl-CoA thioester hydrolase
VSTSAIPLPVHPEPFGSAQDRPVEGLRQAQPERVVVQPAQEFTWPIRVYWEDTDAGGIVFYANYLKFFERARTEWLRALGIGQQALRDTTGGMFVVTDAQLKYHQPARLDDELLVTADLIESGRASLTIRQRALKCDSQMATPFALSSACPEHVEGSKGTEGFDKLSPNGISANAQLVCQGTIRIGWVDATTMKPQRIPQAVLEALK